MFSIRSIPSTLRIHDKDIPLKATRSRRAKRITLRVDITHQCINLTLPLYRISQKTALAFIESHRDWLAKKILHFSSNTPLSDGATFPILGTHYTLSHREHTRGKIYTEGNILHITCLTPYLDRRLHAYLHQQLKMYLEEKCHYYAALLGATIKHIRVSDTTSRWGSCSSKGTLSFCWRLVFAPPAIIDYVIAHEVCHLKEMNHSPAFWSLVASLCPGYKTHRQWLKKNGGTLHRYDKK